MSQPITLAQLGFIQEYGTPRIPPRPFLMPAMAEGRERLKKENARLLHDVMMGKLDMHTALGQLGAFGQMLVQQKIRATTTPPNAPSTIRRKGSSHPLIDSGQMMRSVAWEYAPE